MSSILSVGIDIGTSTTQVIFSRITMDNMAGYFSAPRIAITGKELIYKSKIHFTPLKTPVLLDGDGVRDIVAAEFAQAGFRPEDVDTGAVIITGESARKENAAVVLEKLSSFAGEFVVSTAGPDLESVIAGKEQVLFVVDATQERFLYTPGQAAAFSIPVAGVISKIDIATERQIADAREMLELTGAAPIFEVSAVDGRGIDELMAFLL